MLLGHLLTRSCTIVRHSSNTDAAEDDYGNAVRESEPDVDTLETTCELQQVRRDEQQDDLSRTVWLLVLPAGTEIGAGDVVAVDGTDYEVVGDPWEARTPGIGGVTHIEATILRTA